jgi:hypothetical protein
MKKIKLSSPIQYGTELISELEVSPPKAKHMRGMALQMGMDDMLTLASRCTAQPPSVIDELSFNDLTAVMEVLGNFLGSSPPTGKTP